MRNLSTYFNTPFDDRDISLNELAAYTTDHLERMSANDPGGDLAARIAATSTAMAALDSSFTDDQTKLGLRKARKLAKDNFRKDLPREAGKIVAAAIAFYGDGAPEVLELVPQGRTVFSSARDDELENHLDTLVNGVTAHQADLGAPLLTQATDLRDAWLAIYAASEASTGAKTATEEEKRTARRTLQWELYLNVFKLAEMFPRQPEKASLYMQMHLLGYQSGGGSGSGGDGGNGGGGGNGGSGSSSPGPLSSVSSTSSSSLSSLSSLSSASSGSSSSTGGTP